MNARILVIDDEKDLAWALCEKLRREGYEAENVSSGEEALAVAKEKPFSLAIVDYQLPGINGIETLKELKKIKPDMSAIFITAYGDHELAWNSLENGADEYINKPFNLRNLSFFVFKLLRSKAMEAELNVLRDKSNARQSKSHIVYRSTAMENIMRRIDTIARASATVLITGETGTGKELIATAIHHNTANPRKDSPFIAINCAAIPEPLIESELFGHTRGAFTGAILSKKGVFEAADGGTLFLDELSSASPALQQKLLRAIETGEFYPLGDVKVKNTDVFIIAATNKDLAREVAEERFRADLFHRLKIVQIDIPPLRERIEDIDPLTDFFLSHFNTQENKQMDISPEARKAMNAYTWPGNVRELKNTVHGIVSELDIPVIEPHHLPSRIADAAAISPKGTFTELKSALVEDFERNYFASILWETKGNVSETARRAGIARVNLINKLKTLGLDPKKFRPEGGAPE